MCMSVGWGGKLGQILRLCIQVFRMQPRTLLHGKDMRVETIKRIYD